MNKEKIDNYTLHKDRMFLREGELVTENTYNLTIGLTILGGIGLNVLMALFLTPYILRMNYLAVLIVYFAGSFTGAAIVEKAKRVGTAAFGFTLMAASMGILLTWLVTGYSFSSIYTAFLMTGIVTVLMMLISLVIPAFFLSIGSSLFLALICVLIVEVVGRLVFRMPLRFLDYAIVVIFSGYIGYDWAKAQAFPKSRLNAVKSAADIYLDIINIFVRILSIIGEPSS